MSTEDIIRAWKNEPENEPSEAPANPAGEQELSDEELAIVEGGSGVCSCNDNSCKGQVA